MSKFLGSLVWVALTFFSLCHAGWGADDWRADAALTITNGTIDFSTSLVQLESLGIRLNVPKNESAPRVIKMHDLADAEMTAIAAVFKKLKTVSTGEEATAAFMPIVYQYPEIAASLKSIFSTQVFDRSDFDYFLTSLTQRVLKSRQVSLIQKIDALKQSEIQAEQATFKQEILTHLVGRQYRGELSHNYDEVPKVPVVSDTVKHVVETKKLVYTTSDDREQNRIRFNKVLAQVKCISQASSINDETDAAVIPGNNHADTGLHESDESDFQLQTFANGVHSWAQTKDPVKRQQIVQQLVNKARILMDTARPYISLTRRDNRINNEETEYPIDLFDSALWTLVGAMETIGCGDCCPVSTAQLEAWSLLAALGFTIDELDAEPHAYFTGVNGDCMALYEVLLEALTGNEHDAHED